MQRIGILYAAPDVEALGSIRSLRLHALKGDRAGQYAIDLTGPVRLIVTFSGEHTTVVRVEEVSKHYD